jgi:hypothetical protein
MRFSPRLHSVLVDHVQHIDVDRMSIAEAWRSTCCEAERLELTRPGYHAVRLVVCVERERRAARRQVLLEVLSEPWRYPGPDVLGLAERVAATRRQPR